MKVKGLALCQYFTKYEDVRLTPGQPFRPCFRGGRFSRKASAMNFQNTASRGRINCLLTLERTHDGLCLRPSLIISQRCNNYPEYVWRCFGLAEWPVVCGPFPHHTRDFRSFWEHVASDLVENPSKVGDGARRQGCDDDRLYNVVTKPGPNS